MAKSSACCLIQICPGLWQMDTFDTTLKDQGYSAIGGQMIDATDVPVPKQRNTEAEKAAIKEECAPGLKAGSGPSKNSRCLLV